MSTETKEAEKYLWMAFCGAKIEYFSLVMKAEMRMSLLKVETMGYMSSSPKFDVYAFGVVMTVNYWNRCCWWIVIIRELDSK